MPTIFDNIETEFLENASRNGLRDALKVARRGDFCVGYFNLRGWRHIDDVVETWQGDGTAPCRLLVGMQRLPQEDLPKLFADRAEDERIDNKTVARLKRQAAADFSRQLTIGIPTARDEAGLRKLVQQLRSGKLTVKLYLRHTLHAKLYLAHRDDSFNPVLAFLGSSNLTMSGLRGQGELNIDVLDKDAGGKLVQWFKDRWEDERCLNITEDLIAVIEESWAGERLIPPHHIYLKMAWHLSEDARDGVKEFRIPHDVAGELMQFQVKAVQLACRHLNKRGGVLVGDVVGLGKTRVASAIARVMGDDQMLETLIICPKNLVPMWEDYARRFMLRAPNVLSQSRAQKQLEKLPRYRLIIIDESHNFRNREGKIYQAIRDYIERNDSKVVLLSATPYNKTYLDLANQLRLFLNEQLDIGIRPENLLREKSESQFSLENPNTPLSSLAAFEQSTYADDWREVMRLFLVRRTRSFIIANYAERDRRDGRYYLTLTNGVRAYFPDRKPHTVKFDSDPNDPNDPCARLFQKEIVDIIDSLLLPRYGLSGYKKETLPSDLTAADLKILEDLSRAGKRLKGFCRTNLFKRLESSGHAFLLSLHRHILRNEIFIYAVENAKPVPIGQQDSALLDTRVQDQGDGELDLEGDAEELPPLHQWDRAHYRAEAARIYKLLSSTQTRRYRWLRADVFKKTFIPALEKDARSLQAVLTATGEIPYAKDKKLQALIELLGKDCPKEKFLLFTQFADTAAYLNNALHAAGLDAFAQDAVENAAPDLLLALLKAIRRVSVLDPTCGSGAFLFAALNILEPLYRASLDRMRMLLGDWESRGEKHPNYRKEFSAILEQAAQHPNENYFIFKSIIVHNLYGVDIMEEAVEICKLRLFLKLAAQLEPGQEIEPLPDIDFNIRAGNTLVGYVSRDEVRRCMTQFGDGQMRLGVEDELQSYSRFEEAAENVDKAFQLFQQMQDEFGMNAAEFRRHKGVLSERLQTLRSHLDRFLVLEYDKRGGIDENIFLKWLSSHLPFHWFVEFFGIVSAGGFDVIIGNPPYVETSKVRDYRVLNYLTGKTGNLYSLCVERASALLSPKGLLGMIVPLSGFSTDRMTSYQEVVRKGFSDLFISYYSGDAHPSILFEGVKYRLCIILARGSSNKQRRTFVSDYSRWYASERPVLFQSKLSFQGIDFDKGFLRFSKVGSELAKAVLCKIVTNGSPLERFLRKSGTGHVTYHRSPVFWIRSMDFEPFFKSAVKQRSTDHLKDIYFRSQSEAKRGGALLNSTCFYFWFSVQGNCRNIAGPDVEGFPVPDIESSNMRILEEEFAKLMKSLQKNSRRRVYNYESAGVVEYDEFYPDKSKALIDEIDCSLASNYDFTEEELDFIINYDIKYRMGLSANSGEDSVE